MIDQQTTDTRLAAHCCVWCGRKLSDTHPDDTFCGPECQTAWHTARNNGPHPDIPGQANMLRRLDRENTDAIRRRLRASADHLRNLDEAALEAFQRDDAAIRAELVRTYADTMLAPRPSMAPSNALQLGKSELVYPSLRAIDEPLSEHPYPHYRVALRIRHGYHRPEASTAGDPGDPLPLVPVRHCNTCLSYGEPDEQWRRNGLIGGALGRALRLAQCCPHCGAEYPGAPAVPVIRYGQDMDAWEVRVITTPGVASTRLDGGILRGLPPGAAYQHAREYLWQGLYRQATLNSGPPCHIPACPNRASKWIGIGAALHWRGYRWAPDDGMPLRIGLCLTHSTDLHHDIHTDTALVHRVHIDMDDHRLTIQ